MSGSEIKIISLNCQGLGLRQKRASVLNHLRNKKYSIICLSDTHFSKGQEPLLTTEWGYRVFFSSYSTQKRGVAIFFNNNFEFKIHRQYNDQKGNLLLLDIETENRRITLGTVYGPNTDDPLFYDCLLDQLVKMGNNDILLSGDWNILLNPEIDGTNYKHVNNPINRQKVLKIMSDLNLFDIWRDSNICKRMYTWKRKLASGKIQMGRLDFILVSETLLGNCRKESIVPGFRSDHSAVDVTLVFNQVNRGKTFWKFNSTLLKNINYVKEIKSVILNVKKQYAASPYNLELLNDIDNKHFHTVITPQLFF